MLNIRKQFGFLSTVAVTATFLVGAVQAQSLREARGPAEFPPSTFTANQYVDSRGCVFVRAGIGGTVDWVPRVSRDRNQLCGFQPTQVAGTTSAAPVPNVPNPLDTQVAGLAPRTAPVTAPATRPAPAAAPAPAVQAAPTPAPTPVVVAAPNPTVNAPAPRQTLPTTTSNAINPLTGRPVGAAPAAPVTTAPVTIASPSPRVVTAPAAASQPRTLTRAQACAGRTGVQPNLISQRTGQPINCGGTTVAPQVAAVTSPIVQQPTTQSRFSRAQACADAASSGRRYVSATTGLPLQCGTQAGGGISLAQIRADLALPQRPYSNPLDSAPGSTGPLMARTTNPIYSNPLDSAPGTTAFTPGVNTRLTTNLAENCQSGTGVVDLRCGPQTQSPSGVTGPIATVTRARTTPSGQGFLADVLGQTPPPYSNPTNSYALPAPTAPAGYTAVWNDGRLNTQRGLPNGGVQVRAVDGLQIRTGPQSQSPSGYNTTVRYATAPVPQPAVQQPTGTTTRAVAPAPQRAEQISGHRYVQVTTLASRDQAQAIAQSLRSRGLPMRIGVFEQNGQQMRIVLAGPFGTDTQLQNALGTARGAGYSGAFTRR